MADIQQAIKLAGAIARVESGGNYQARGGSGEYGAFQYMPATWKSTAKAYLGDENAPMTKGNQNKATVKKVAALLDKGYKPEQVAAVWNSGQPTWEGKVGVNKYGQRYDVPAYVNKVISQYNKSNKISMASAQPTQQAQQPTQTSQTKLWQAIDVERKKGKTDTELLDEIKQRMPQSAAKIDALRQKAAATNRSDREVLNYLSKQISGQEPTVPSVPIKEEKQEEGVSGIAGFGLGAAKELAKRPFTIGGLGERMIGSALKTILPKSAEKAIGVENAPTLGLFGQQQGTTGGEKILSKLPLEQKGTAEKLGRMAEQVGEFFIPGGASLKAGKALGAATKAGKIIKGATTLAGTSLAEGVLGTSQSALQSGKVGKEELKAGALSLIAPPAVATAGKVLKTATKPFVPLSSKITQAIGKAVDKAIKPSITKIGTTAAKSKYYKKAAEAFNVIRKYKPTITTADGVEEAITPNTRGQMLEALEKTKSIVFQRFDDIAKESGDIGAKFNPKKIITQLKRVSNDVGYSPEIRNYAAKEIDAISELTNASPSIIQRRIREYNEGLSGFYAGRIDKAKARVDASVANLLREELDDLIANTTGRNYQYFKNEYSALKEIEKDLARQVAIEARKVKAGLIDFSDIFTGGDLTAGIITGNPAILLKGLTGRGIKEIYKYLNDPDRYIKKAFELINKSPIEPEPIVVGTQKLLTAPKTGQVKQSINSPIYLGQRSPSTIEAEEIAKFGKGGY
jgi:hypothetical protein